MAQCPDQQVLDPGWIFLWNVAVLSSNNSWFDRNEEEIGQGISWEAEQSVFGQSILKKQSRRGRWGMMMKRDLADKADKNDSTLFLQPWTGIMF